MDDDEAARGRAHRGWPVGEHNPYLVEGEIEQFGKLAAGLRHNRAGRRRALRLLLWLVLVLVVVSVAGFWLWPPPPR